MLIPVVYLGWSSVEGAVFFKYTDKNGTVVFTEALSEIPANFRKDAEEIVIPDKAPPNSSAPFHENVTGKGIQKRQVTAYLERREKEVFGSFLREKKFFVLAYLIGSVLLIAILSSIVKKIFGSTVIKMFLHLAFVAALFGGGYLLYLSWVDKTYLSLDQNGDEGLTWVEQVVTPKKILEKTKKTVDQLNAKSKAHQKRLEALDED